MEEELAPTFVGFLPKHIKAMIVPIIIYIISWALGNYLTNQYLRNFVFTISIIGLLIIAWQKWWSETFATLTLTFLMIAAVTFNDTHSLLNTLVLLIPNYSKYGLWLKYSIVSMAVVMLYLELFRLSIKYIITDDAIKISGGLIFKKTRTIVSKMINDVVYTKMPLFNVGNVAVATASGLSLQEDYRSAGVGKNMRSGFFGMIMSTRSRKNINDDPLQILYGVKEPDRVAELIIRMSTLDRELSRQSVQLLEEINEKMEKDQKVS